MKDTQGVALNREDVNLGQSSPKGSRFAILESEEEGAREIDIQQSQENYKEMENIIMVNSQEQEEEIREKNTVTATDTCINNRGQEVNNTQHGRQETNVQLMRSKSIMERFVKVKNSEENRLAGSLKASGSGILKHQKSNKPQMQWERAKSLILSEENEWNNAPNSQGQHQGGSGSKNHNSRPPDTRTRPPNTKRLPQSQGTARRQEDQLATQEKQMERSPVKGIASNMEC